LAVAILCAWKQCVVFKVFVGVDEMVDMRVIKSFRRIIPDSRNCNIYCFAYPLPFFTLVYVGEGYFWTVLRMLTFVILAIIYSYDRWILKPDKMKKKYLIVLVGQTLLILLMLMYAFVQKSEADRQRDAAEISMMKAMEAERKAMQVLKACEGLRQKNEGRSN
jgi:hypothetical protein